MGVVAGRNADDLHPREGAVAAVAAKEEAYELSISRRVRLGVSLNEMVQVFAAAADAALPRERERSAYRLCDSNAHAPRE